MTRKPSFGPSPQKFTVSRRDQVLELTCPRHVDGKANRPVAGNNSIVVGFHFAAIFAARLMERGSVAQAALGSALLPPSRAA